MHTPAQPVRDALHRLYARLFPSRVASAGGRHSRRVADPTMRTVGAIRRKMAAEYVIRDAHRALRAECERVAAMLDGARRGRAESVFYRGKLRREAMAAVRRMPARTRFAATAAVGHVRTAARETAAVAASTARRMGAAHRHVPGTTDVQHDLVARLVRYAKQYERTRAAGERSMWAQGSGRMAW